MEIVNFTNFNELRSSKESKLKTSHFNGIGEFKAFNAQTENFLFQWFTYFPKITTFKHKQEKTSYFIGLRIFRKLRHLRHKHGKASFINGKGEIY